MEVTVPLILRFIALIFFIGIVENLVEFIVKSLHKPLPDYKAFSISFVIAYLICFLGDFKFFEALDVYFITKYIDYGMSAVVVAAGSGFLQRKFDIMNTIPSIITGIRIGSANKKKIKRSEEEVIEETYKEDEDSWKYY